MEVFIKYVIFFLFTFLFIYPVYWLVESRSIKQNSKIHISKASHLAEKHHYKNTVTLHFKGPLLHIMYLL